MAPSLESLPVEIFLQVISYLEVLDIVRLQLVSKQLLRTGRDDGFWRLRSFDDSTYLETLMRRRMLFGQRSVGVDEQRAPASPTSVEQERSRERFRIMANWDPVYPGEKVSWYDEYIQRNAPIVMNWFQLPRHSDSSSSKEVAVEARGVALYRPDGADGSLLAVSPLDDGSVCLWDVKGTRGQAGAIVAQSAPGILFGGLLSDLGRATRRQRPQFTTTECVSVDSQRHLAFLSVQNRLVEVDLQRLVATGEETFPWAITALSTSHPTVPLSIGMHLGVHMHDTRVRAGNGTSKHTSRNYGGDDDDDDRCQPRCAPAPHPEPGPISILHLQRPGSEEDMSDDIYTAGRLPIILHYDRRKLSSIKGTIYSGASLCSMTSFPYPFSALDSDLRHEGVLSLGQVERAKAVPGGRTIVACGEYKSKGSLEMYGIGMVPEAATTKRPEGVQYRENSTLKNRQTSSFSKILAVTTHGTRLAFADGAGQIKWFERDGVTEVRSCAIDGGESKEMAPSLFGPAAQDSGDIARKLLPTQQAGGSGDNELLFWTGERLGLVSFSSKPGFETDDFVDLAKTARERAAETQERAYSARMRQLLEKQASDVRFVRNLGVGSGRRDW
ncbi:f-box domain containing protein [Grosmannia clavigera kw1407]|uniref:F-box domain containing protein n=1 Tax=Grosmannia clavigera (strain kw1407 / UAMH 11150) TaxID=655863 RepID=F0XT33_GROCL|nr:f-box domain containing protein [Grosmannia clavigera kw1407]EFW99350.1 f-box domain containing protein [Grosmannia clavigera kw1407]